MMTSPEERRERLRQEELKQPSSSDHRSNLADLIDGQIWKVTGFVLLVLIFVFSLLFVL